MVSHWKSEQQCDEMGSLLAFSLELPLVASAA